MLQSWKLVDPDGIFPAEAYTTQNSIFFIFFILLLFVKVSGETMLQNC